MGTNPEIIKKKMKQFLEACKNNHIDELEKLDINELIRIRRIHSMEITKVQYTRSQLFVPNKSNSLASLSKNNRTMLHYACLHSTQRIVRYIMEKYLVNNMIPDEQDKEGDTPLHLAIQNRRFDIIIVLLNCISKIKEPSRIQKLLNTQNKEGNTPYHLICKWYNRQIRENGRICKLDSIIGFFKRFAADDTIKNNKGITPLGNKCTMLEDCNLEGFDPQLGWKDDAFDPELGCITEFDPYLGGGSKKTRRRRQRKGKKSRRSH
jgi:ankyrin repeat protein